MVNLLRFVDQGDSQGINPISIRFNAVAPALERETGGCARQAADLVPRFQKLRDEPSADVPRCARDQDPHPAREARSIPK